MLLITKQNYYNVTTKWIKDAINTASVEIINITPREQNEGGV